jgi:hypothetical protein
MSFLDEMEDKTNLHPSRNSSILIAESKECEDGGIT